MKLHHALIAIGLLFASSSVQAFERGEDLFNVKCLACHIKTKPNDPSTLVAPPLMGVMRHTKMEYNTKEEAVAFITQYVLNPQRDKAVCMPKTIERFGLMPSQKGIVSEDELKYIASWMYDNYPQQNMNGRSNNNCKSGSCNSKKCNTNKSQKNKKMAQKKGKKFSPFLINSKGMPHMTSLVKRNWDNPALALSPDQKEILLEIKKRTMKSVLDLSPRIKKLENEIKIITMKGEDKNDIYMMVDQLAKLKSAATKTHVECITDTLKVLDNKQEQFLLKR